MTLNEKHTQRCCSCRGTFNECTTLLDGCIIYLRTEYIICYSCENRLCKRCFGYRGITTTSNFNQDDKRYYCSSECAFITRKHSKFIEEIYLDTGTYETYKRNINAKKYEVLWRYWIAKKVFTSLKDIPSDCIGHLLKCLYYEIEMDKLKWE